MDQTQENKQPGQIENYEKYLLHGRGEIIQKLRQLAKSKSMITAHFSNQSMLTAVVDVLSDKNLLVLDYGANEQLNNKILEANRVICKTQVNGITAQFTVENLTRAKLKGKQALACELPESLVWVQRREAYRVKVPLGSQATLQVTRRDVDQNQQILDFTVIDISASGLALKHINNLHGIPLEPGEHYAGCILTLPNIGTHTISIEIRNQVPLPEENELRIGCMIVGSDHNLDSMVQRYIHAIDAIQRQTV